MARKKAAKKINIEDFGPDAALGDIFKGAREKNELTINDAVEATRIMPTYIEAMERSDFAALPGSIYTKAYIKSYANFLKLNSDELISRFEESNVKEVPAPEEDKTSEPFKEALNPSTLIVVLSLVVALGIYFFWYIAHDDEVAVDEQTEGVIDAYTGASHDIVVMATGEMNLSVTSLSDGTTKVVYEGYLENGDTYFMPDTKGLVFKMDKPEAAEFYVDGNKVAALDNLERAQDGYVLDVDKMLAAVEVR